MTMLLSHTQTSGTRSSRLYDSLLEEMHLEVVQVLTNICCAFYIRINAFISNFEDIEIPGETCFLCN